MRKLKILKVNPVTPGIPGSIEVTGNYTQLFKGKFYRGPAGETEPAYTDPAPSGYVKIVATTFDLIENTRYAGRYTVYTPADALDQTPESIYAGGKTRIYVNEVVTPLNVGDPSTLESDGYITNISTYLLYTGTEEILIPPGVDITGYPIEFMGRGVSGWGESFAQNGINTARNFAGGIAPVNPFVGQTWYSTDDGQLRSFDGVSWELVNKASFGVTFRHTQGSASSTWTVNHLLGLQAPYIAFVQFFIERGQGPKLILPADVNFVGANQLTVSFSNPEIGYVLVRA